MKIESRANLRKDLEKFLIWYSVVYIIAAIITGFGIPYAIKQMILGKGSDMTTSVAYLFGLGPHLTGVVAAVWLWRREHPGKRGQVIWAIFGLAASLWAVGMYLLVFALSPLESPHSAPGDDTDAKT